MTLSTWDRAKSSTGAMSAGTHLATRRARFERNSHRSETLGADIASRTKIDRDVY